MSGWTEIISNVQKCRDETARCCEDLVSSDGIILYSKEQGLESVAQYDLLLNSLNKLVCGA